MKRLLYIILILLSFSAKAQQSVQPVPGTTQYQNTARISGSGLNALLYLYFGNGNYFQIPTFKQLADSLSSLNNKVLHTTGNESKSGKLTLTDSLKAVNLKFGNNPSYGKLAMAVNDTTMNSHSFDDYSVITSHDNGLGYGVFDASTTLTGSTDNDHIIAFQARQKFLGTGTLGFSGYQVGLVGFYYQPTIDGFGVVKNARGVFITNPLGSAKILTNTGIIVDNMTRGNQNYAIWTGLGKNLFGDTTAVLANLGVGTANPHLNVGSSSRYVEVNGTTNPGILLTSGGYQYLLYNGGDRINIFDANSSTDAFSIPRSSQHALVYGQTIWDSGNFNPANYVPLSSANQPNGYLKLDGSGNADIGTKGFYGGTIEVGGTYPGANSGGFYNMSATGNGMFIKGGALGYHNTDIYDYNNNLIAYILGTKTYGASDNLALITKQYVDPVTTFYTDAANSGTTETDLYSYSLAANSLNYNGKQVLAKYSVDILGTGGTKYLKAYFAGTALNLNATSSAANTKVEVTIIRSGSSTARAMVSITYDNSSSRITETDLTGLDFTAANILKITGMADAGTGGEITAKFGSIELK